MPMSSCLGDQKASRPSKKDDFLKALPRRDEYFKSLGLISSKVEGLEISKLDSRYVLARAAWNMRFQHDGTAPVDSEISASYILSITGKGLEVVFQIDHQDLAKKAQELSPTS